YVIRYPAKGDLSCEAGQQYKAELKKRQAKEQRTLEELMGWDTNNYPTLNDFLMHSDENKKMSTKSGTSFIGLLAFIPVLDLLFWQSRRRRETSR
ncbi:MAG: hypothetical protein HRT74_02420, partial [Flavobacteriales bacterium]|nr:hypothetical protein [Flavobacteriales bacterium]